jgi:hypothetical protein
MIGNDLYRKDLLLLRKRFDSWILFSLFQGIVKVLELGIIGEDFFVVPHQRKAVCIV